MPPAKAGFRSQPVIVPLQRFPLCVALLGRSPALAALVVGVSCEVYTLDGSGPLVHRSGFDLQPLDLILAVFPPRASRRLPEHSLP